MKSLIVFLFIGAFCQAQENFYIISGRVEWAIQINKDLANKIKRNPNFKDVNQDGDILYGKLEEMPINLCGQSRGSTTMILLASNLTGAFEIDLSQDYPTLKITNLMFNSNMDIKYMQDKTTFESYALKRGEFTKRFIGKDSEVLDCHLNSLL